MLFQLRRADEMPDPLLFSGREELWMLCSHLGLMKRLTTPIMWLEA